MPTAREINAALLANTHRARRYLRIAAADTRIAMLATGAPVTAADAPLVGALCVIAHDDLTDDWHGPADGLYCRASWADQWAELRDDMAALLADGWLCAMAHGAADDTDWAVDVPTHGLPDLSPTDRDGIRLVAAYVLATLCGLQYKTMLVDRQLLLNGVP